MQRMVYGNIRKGMFLNDMRKLCQQQKYFSSWVRILLTQENYLVYRVKKYLPMHKAVC